MNETTSTRVGYDKTLKPILKEMTKKGKSQKEQKTANFFIFVIIAVVIAVALPRVAPTFCQETFGWSVYSELKSFSDLFN